MGEYVSMRFTTSLQQIRDQARPARLMAGTYTRAIVTMEVFIEQKQITPIGVLLKFLDLAMDRPTALIVA